MHIDPERSLDALEGAALGLRGGKERLRGVLLGGVAAGQVTGLRGRRGVDRRQEVLGGVVRGDLTAALDDLPWGLAVVRGAVGGGGLAAERAAPALDPLRVDALVTEVAGDGELSDGLEGDAGEEGR